MLLDRAELSKLIPHSDTMCLLDGVLSWDENSIHCISNSHQSLHNPLRLNNQLSALCAFEYGAQAAAVHGGLCAQNLSHNQQSKPSYLAALKDGHCYVDRLDTIDTSLQINAQMLFRQGASQIYQTHISAADVAIAEVRITVMAQGN